MTKANQHFYWDNLPRREAIAMLFDRAVMGRKLSLVRSCINKRPYVHVRSNEMNDDFRILFSIKEPTKASSRWHPYPAPTVIIGDKKIYWRSAEHDAHEIADYLADKQCYVMRKRT